MQLCVGFYPFKAAGECEGISVEKYVHMIFHSFPLSYLTARANHAGARESGKDVWDQWTRGTPLLNAQPSSSGTTLHG